MKADAGAAGLMMPLDVLLECMRQAWSREDLVTAQSAAAQAAPYCHARLHAIEAKTETTVIVASADELRERARTAIRQAFQEREVLTGPVIEHDPEDETSLHVTTRHSTAHHATQPHATATTRQFNDAGLSGDDS